MRSFSVFLFLSLLFISPAIGQQIIEVTNDGTIHGEISANGITRLHLIEDEVAGVHISDGGHSTAVSFVKEPSTGDIYLKLSDQIVKTHQHSIIDFFLTTQRGYTYQAELTVTQNTASQIIIRNPQITQSKNKLGRTNQKLEETVISIVRAINNDRVLDGYKVKRPNNKIRDLGSLQFHTKSLFIGNQLTGQLLVIRNPAPGNVTLNEKMFLTSGVLAVSILGNRRLGTSETSKVILVGYSNGDSLL